MSGEPGCLGKLKPKYRPSVNVLEEYGHWEAPGEVAARELYLKTHAHHGVLEVSCPIRDLSEFGEGVQLYFVLLKATAIVFCGLALLPGLPLLVFNGIGGWYDEADLERTMLGNFGLLTHNGAGSELNLTTSGVASRSSSQEGSVTALFAGTAGASPARVWGMNKENLLLAMSALDLVGVVVFFVYSMGVMLYVKRLAPTHGPSATTIAEYTVRVEGLPHDTSAGPLREYLTRAAGEGAEVLEVELCRAVNDLLALVVERGEKVKESELALAVVQRKAEVSLRVPENLIVDLLFYRYEVESLTEAIHQQQAAAKTNEVVTAFVTLSSHESRQRLLRALPRSLVHQWRMKPEERFNNGGIGDARIKPVALTVSAAPEPSDLYYQNLEYSRVERGMRAIATNIAKFFVLFLGFLLVSLAPAMKMGVAGLDAGPSKTSCTASCSYTNDAGSFVLSDSNRILYKQCDPKAGSGVLNNKLDCEDTGICYECFCRAALNAGVYGEVPYCSRFSSVMGIYTLAQALAVLGVVLANALIEIAITWLVGQEKHHTRTREAVGITRGLFMTTLANTAFSNLVANMYLPGPADLIAGSFISGYIFTGSFADTTPNWYHDVCRPIVISLFLTTVIINGKVAFRWWWRRRCLASRYQCLTEWQLEEAYEGHEFQLSLKYGQHLYVIYVVMAYSAGAPLMYVLAAVHFVSCYWSEKYELLRLCRRPLSYGRQLATYFSSSLPFAALWHLAFGTWCFSLFGTTKSPLIPQAFRRSLEASVRTFKSLMPAASSLTPQLVAWRLTENSAAHLFLAFILCAMLLFLYFTTSIWLALMLSLARQLGFSTGVEGDGGAGGDKNAVIALPEFSSAVRNQLLIGPASYSVQKNPAYAHAFMRIDDIQWEVRQGAQTATGVQPYDPFTGLPVTSANDSASQPQQPPPVGGTKRTVANRLRAQQKAASMPDNGPNAQVIGSKPAVSNKIVPEPVSPFESKAPQAQVVPAELWQRPGSADSHSAGVVAKAGKDVADGYPAEGKEGDALERRGLAVLSPSAGSREQLLTQQATFVGQPPPKAQQQQQAGAEPREAQQQQQPVGGEVGESGSRKTRSWAGLDME